MKHWASVVAVLYGLMLGVFAAPFALAAFWPSSTGKGLASDIGELYGYCPLWLFLVVMGLAQAAFLAVPVRMAERRPVARRPLVLTVLSAALMMGVMVGSAFCCVWEFIMRDKDLDNDSGLWIAIGLAFAGWCVWAVIFFRLSRKMEPQDLVTRLCKSLLKGSILELLIAVPTHIVARCRDYCCAGVMTFIGLTLGMSVMLFSFGPGVLFLFVARWRQLHPQEA